MGIAGPDDVATAFRNVTTGRAEAILVIADQVFNLLAAQISAFALSNRLPTMFSNRHLMDAGGLMAYSPDFFASYRRAATFVDKILKGARTR